MKTKIGDKVRFLNEEGGGIISKIIDNKKAYVLTDDGFEIPYLINELVIIEKNQEELQDLEEDISIDEEESIDTDSSSINDAEENKNNETKVYENSSIYKPILAITRDDSEYNLFLINDGDYFLLYVLSYYIDDKVYYLEHNEVEPEMIIKLSKFTTEKMNQYNKLYINILPFNKKSYVNITPKQYYIELNKLGYNDISNYQINDYFDSKAILINLSEYSEIEKQKEHLKNLVAKNIKPKETKSTKEKELEEVDLHIDKIVSDEQLQKMTAGEILETQIARFITALEGAIRNNTKRIVFIHGVGNGKLRYEIQRILKQRYPKLKYQDASFEEYGYGATMIILKK